MAAAVAKTRSSTAGAEVVGGGEGITARSEQIRGYVVNREQFVIRKTGDYLDVHKILMSNN